MTIELNPRQERMLYDAMRQQHFQSVDETLDAALRSLTTAAQAASVGAPTSPAEAASRILELRRGNRLPDGVTIRSLIEDGRG